MGQIEELIRKLLGNLGGVVGDPVSSVTSDLRAKPITVTTTAAMLAPTTKNRS